MVGQNSKIKPNPSRLPWDCVVCSDGGWNISLWADWGAVGENLCRAHLHEHLNPFGDIEITTTVDEKKASK